jgi:GNAT superfamily N-acetyltransferase
MDTSQSISTGGAGNRRPAPKGATGAKGDSPMPIAAGPRSDSATETLADGRRVIIRPIRPDDVARNSEFLESLSPPSRHFLFLGGIARLNDEELGRLCNPDHASAMAFVALAADPKGLESNRQVGVCRYAGAGSANGAEISVAVADDWQQQGLGRKLLLRLIDYARTHGVKRLYSMDSAANDRMRKLGEELGFVAKRDPDDMRQIILSLDLR